jgi:hypothetical protein
MHVDNILAGLRPEDKKVALSTADSRDRQLKEKEQKYAAPKRGGMPAIHEDKFEARSHSSATSQAIDDIMYRGKDPRRNKYEPAGLSKVEEEKSGPFLGHDELKKFKQNSEFFRQNEAIMQQIPIEERFRFDKSLDLFFQHFCKTLIKEIANGPIKKDVSSYVDYYGKEVKGFLTYPEFKEIYLVHISQSF